MKQIIGLRINKIALEQSMLDGYEKTKYNNDIITEYEFIYKENNQLYSAKLQLEKGMCGSGYCGAEWIHENVSPITEVGSLHYTPKEPLELKTLVTGYDGNDSHTYYEYACPYYPSAELSINKNAWKAT